MPDQKGLLTRGPSRSCTLPAAHVTQQPLSCPTDRASPSAAARESARRACLPTSALARAPAGCRPRVGWRRGSPPPSPESGLLGGALSPLIA